jgi:hypothetical protein
MPIKRYDQTDPHDLGMSGVCGGDLHPVADGDWVLYDHHEQVVEELEAELAKAREALGLLSTLAPVVVDAGDPVSMAQDIVGYLKMEAAHAEKQQAWVPVADALPTEHIPVLVHGDGDDGESVEAGVLVDG